MTRTQRASLDADKMSRPRSLLENLSNADQSERIDSMETVMDLSGGDLGRRRDKL